MYNRVRNHSKGSRHAAATHVETRIPHHHAGGGFKHSWIFGVCHLACAERCDSGSVLNVHDHPVWPSSGAHQIPPHYINIIPLAIWQYAALVSIIPSPPVHYSSKRITRFQWLKTWMILSIVRECSQNCTNNTVPLVNLFPDFWPTFHLSNRKG